MPVLLIAEHDNLSLKVFTLNAIHAASTDSREKRPGGIDGKRLFLR